MELKVKISKLLREKEKPQRQALSSRYPFLVGPILFYKRFVNKVKNFFNFKIARTDKPLIFDKILVRHQSVLRRRLGNSEMRLQEQKVTNLRVAAQALNGLIIKPGEIFSLWEAIGKPTRKRGYVNGMLLSNGKIIEDVGGGLCQLSNLLCWLFLHVPMEIVERYHHSMDVFPDSGRVLPFGSGATIHYNTIDLKIKNLSNTTWQIKIWLTDKYLKVRLLGADHLPNKFHIIEKNHVFVKSSKGFYRYNEIWRQKKYHGKVLSEEHLFTNFAPVLYGVNQKYLQDRNYKLIDLSE